MVTDLKGMALWEVLRNLKGIFSGSGGGSPKEPPLSQEVASILDPLSDEAILLPTDAAIKAAKGAEAWRYIQALNRIMQSLKPHQREQWRKIVAKHRLTEKFEKFTVSEKTIKQGGSQNAEEQAQGQRRRDETKPREGKAPREEITKTFDRRARDYEWTNDDPRVQHFILIADLYLDTMGRTNGTEGEKEEAGLKAARDYLLAKGLITEKSLMEIGEEKLGKARDAAIGATYHGLTKLALGDEYERIAGSAKDDADLERLLSEALKRKSDEKKQELAAIKSGDPSAGTITTPCFNLKLPSKRVIIAGIGISIAAAIMIVTASL